MISKWPHFCKIHRQYQTNQQKLLLVLVRNSYPGTMIMRVLIEISIYHGLQKIRHQQPFLPRADNSEQHTCPGLPSTSSPGDHDQRNYETLDYFLNLKNNIKQRLSSMISAFKIYILSSKNILILLFSDKMKYLFQS